MKVDNYKGILEVIDNRSLVDKVESKLLDFFVRSGLKPNDLIPKELQLTEYLGVSRTVVRESINRLKNAGIIESIKHKGTIIKSPNLGLILQKSLIPNILDESTLKDIFELRLVLEIGMADLIFNRVKNEDIEELFEIVSKEPEKSDTTLFDIDHEIKFHGKLYDISGNSTLKQFQVLLLPIFNYAYESGLLTKSIKKVDYVSHKELVEILKKGKPSKFRESMRLHLENHFKRIFS